MSSIFTNGVRFTVSDIVNDGKKEVYLDGNSIGYYKGSDKSILDKLERQYIKYIELKRIFRK